MFNYLNANINTLLPISEMLTSVNIYEALAINWNHFHLNFDIICILEIIRLATNSNPTTAQYYPIIGLILGWY